MRVSTLEAKAVVQLARDNLAYYDHVLEISRERFKAGDIAQLDLDRLELQRLQYESDLESAEVNLRTAKIQLLTLLNDRTRVERFDVTGSFDFVDQLASREEFRGRLQLSARTGSQARIASRERTEGNRNCQIQPR